MPNISQTRQIITDLFYQAYTTDENFLQPEHFQYLIGCYYNSLLIADYNKSKQENFAESGLIYPTFSQEMVVPKEVTVEKDGDFKVATIDDVVMFPYDIHGYGVQSVSPLQNIKCGPFKRTTVGMKDTLCQLPYTKHIWFWIQGRKIYFYSAITIPEKLIVNIIPALKPGDDNFFIPQSFETQIITGCIALVKQAAQGVVIDMSNNSNPNAQMQTEWDNVFRNLKTKPN